jgi:aspartate aminotransferase
LNEGDEVLLPDPIYDAYQSPIRLAGGRIKRVATQITKQRFVITNEALEAAWTPAARMLILNTPWNPVGTVLTRQELAVITQFCERRNLVLLSDEIYEAITYGGCRHVSPLAVAPGLRDRAILINSFSKSYSMTGWRVGYCAGPEQIIRAMLLILQQSSRGPATFVQDAAACALTSDQECVCRMNTEYQARRDRVVAGLRGIPGVEPMACEGGLFVMVDVHKLGRPSDEVRRFLLREAGVVVLHGAVYGQGGEGTLRVSFAAGGETLERGLDRLRSGLLRLAAEAPNDGAARREGGSK